MSREPSVKKELRNLCSLFIDLMKSLHEKGAVDEAQYHQHIQLKVQFLSMEEDGICSKTAEKEQKTPQS